MFDIVLTTINAKYIHAAFGLRYLLANMGELQPRTGILEFDLKTRPIEIAERILAAKPLIVGIGVYIWNAVESAELIQLLKRLQPELVIVVGGPEVSYETETHPTAVHADYVITGEADFEFAELCRELLAGGNSERIRRPVRPDVKALALPYDLYSDEDLEHRVLYVEASRGCPFSCEFCLSSLENGVRAFELEPMLAEFDRLIARGALQFKFVDRTFNLSIPVASAILDFFARRLCEGMFLHFEMVPDRLPIELREKISAFPAGVLQFEVGIQTFNPTVAELIHRRQNYNRLAENLRFLRQETGVHVHADLIAGLPGEDLASFRAGFDSLVELDPQEIQVGILKRLRGTPITRHDVEWGMVYSPQPPYQLLKNSLIDFETMQRIGRFSRFWDLVANSGNFRESKKLLWSGDGDSAFAEFMAFADWLYRETETRQGIALSRLVELLFLYLTQTKGLDAARIAPVLLADYQTGGRRDVPMILGSLLQEQSASNETGVEVAKLPKRQSRHLAAAG